MKKLLEDVTTTDNIVNHPTAKVFTVDSKTFAKVAKGREKYERYSKTFNLDEHADLIEYAKKNPKKDIFVKCSESGCLHKMNREKKIRK